jgi:hypothetical protein
VTECRRIRTDLERFIAERDAIQEKIERMGTAIQAIEVRAQETKALRCCEKSLEASVSPASTAITWKPPFAELATVCADIVAFFRLGSRRRARSDPPFAGRILRLRQHGQQSNEAAGKSIR